MADKAKLGAGDVEITLDGEKMVLRPTLRACQGISRQTGGLLEAVRRVGSYDFDQIVMVIGYGLDLKGDELNDLPDKVWRTGLNNLAAPVVKYLTIITHGGRPREEKANKEPDPSKASA